MGGGPADYFEKHPAILQADQPQRFDLRFFADSQRVTFEVHGATRGRGPWSKPCGWSTSKPSLRPKSPPSRGRCACLGELALGQKRTGPFDRWGDWASPSMGTSGSYTPGRMARGPF